MRLPRIYTDQPLSPSQDVTLDPGASRHLVQVLRLRPGADLTLFNGDGCNYHAQLEIASKKQAMARVITRSTPEPETILEIHLNISISKGERMDLAIQKAVELGVSEITPLFSEHGVVNLKGERLERRQQHWRQVIISACEQSGRCRIPKISNAIEMAQWLEIPRQGTSLMLNPKSETSLGSLDRPSNKIHILVGPEGGLSESEITAAERSGYIGICLGPRILRTETAPLAVIASIQTLWGDFR